jgi:hypothetical protein
MFGEREILSDVPQLTVPNPLVYTNAARFGDISFQSWLRRGNVTRTLNQNRLALGKYRQVYLDPTNSFGLVSSYWAIREQIAPWTDCRALLATVEAKKADAIVVDRPCLLAARYGETTWGHWLVEILPKVVLAEAAHPKLFTFVLPAHISVVSSDRIYSTSVLESLEAYGISSDRILRVAPPNLYRFDNLFDVTGVFSDGMHPKALSAMRRVDVEMTTTNNDLVYALRGAAESRCVYNRREITNYLLQCGFHELQMLSLSFAEQVAAFRKAECIASDLGSNLAAVIYAPENVGVISFAPSGWYDGYFVNLFQRLNARHADIRGASTFFMSNDVSKSPHAIPYADVVEGFGILNEGRLKKSNRHVIAGISTPRTVGPPVGALTFGEGAGWRPSTEDGWATPEREHVWSIGPKSSVRLEIAKFFEDTLWLELKGISFVCPPAMPFKPLTVEINGYPLGTRFIQDGFHEFFEVPRRFIGEVRSVVVSFFHPVCPSPEQVGASDDLRQLGFGFSFIALRRSFSDEECLNALSCYTKI